MKQTHKLYACYYIGTRWHSGQFSPGYLLVCYAMTELRKIGITDVERWPIGKWPKPFQSKFRAYYRRLWKQRDRL